MRVLLIIRVLLSGGAAFDCYHRLVSNDADSPREAASCPRTGMPNRKKSQQHRVRVARFRGHRFHGRYINAGTPARAR